MLCIFVKKKKDIMYRSRKADCKALHNVRVTTPEEPIDLQVQIHANSKRYACSFADAKVADRPVLNTTAVCK